MIKVATAPVTEPVSIDELKAHVRYVGTTEDALLASLLTAAREMVEMQARRSLITQTLDLYLEAWPNVAYIVLPRPPLQTVTSITYTDYAGAAGTMAASNYTVYAGVEPGRIVLTSTGTWPAVSVRPGPSIVVKYVAGYGAAAVVPVRYKQAIKLLAGYWWQNREAVQFGAVPHELPMAVKSLIMVDRGWPQ